MTEQQRLTLAMHIADGLKEIGLPITVENIRQQFTTAEKALRTTVTACGVDLHEYAAPDGWAAPLRAMRAALQHKENLKSLEITDSAEPPDPYREGLKALRAKEAR